MKRPFAQPLSFAALGLALCLGQGCDVPPESPAPGPSPVAASGDCAANPERALPSDGQPSQADGRTSPQKPHCPQNRRGDRITPPDADTARIDLPVPTAVAMPPEWPELRAWLEAQNAGQNANQDLNKDASLTP